MFWSILKGDLFLQKKNNNEGKRGRTWYRKHFLKKDKM